MPCVKVLDGARSARLKERPDVLDMPRRAELARGGTAYRASHYTRFGLSSVMGVGVFAVSASASR